MPTYTAVFTLSRPGEYASDMQSVPFEADSDQQAMENGRDFRISLADTFTRSDISAVRVRVLTLELGRWDPERKEMMTTTTRQLLDTWEDDIAERREQLQKWPDRL